LRDASNSFAGWGLLSWPLASQSLFHHGEPIDNQARPNLNRIGLGFNPTGV
jgi:hypothetical protein